MGAVYSYFKNRPQLKTDQIFLNDLILRTILKHLPPKDLVVCRLVHSLWLIETSKILKKGNYLNEIQIVPTIKSQLDAKLHSHADESNVRQWITLQEFLEIIPHSTALLPFNFHMIPNRWEATNYFDDFIHLHGKDITELSLTARMYDSIVMSPQRFAQFEKLLVEQLPNLKILSLGKLPAEFNGASLTFSKFGNFPPKLKSLRTLNISPYCSEAMPLTWIINEAPNLVEIRNRTGKFSVNCLDVLLRLKKGHLIRDMRFEFLTESELRAAGNEAGNLNLKLVDLYSKLAEQQPLLKKITAVSFAGADLMETVLPRLIRILNSWLESSSTSLEILNAESSCALGSFPGLIFPPLPKLTHLGLGLHASDPPRIFPELRHELNLNLLGNINARLDLNLAGVFPNLNWLSLNFDGDVFSLLEPSQVFFEPLTRITSVTKLSFSTEHLVPSISLGWLTYLGKMFPNVSSLTLPRFRASSFVGASRNIWTWRFARSKLRELRLCILVDLNEDNNHIPPILDAAFTGLSIETCNYLIRSGLKGVYTVDKLDPSSMRSDNSILALKYLRKLTVDFVGVQDQLPVSKVSCKLAFDLCLDLETTFSIDNPRLLEKLEIIAPNAKCEIMEY